VKSREIAKIVCNVIRELPDRLLLACSLHLRLLSLIQGILMTKLIRYLNKILTRSAQ
jgi:hypothetical protein